VSVTSKSCSHARWILLDLGYLNVGGVQVRKIIPKIERLEKQIRRAKKFAQHDIGAVADLYLLHAAICEGNRDALRHKVGRRRQSQ